MIDELPDLYLADFGLPCSKGSTTFIGILDTPDAVLDIGGAPTMSTQYDLTLKTADATAIGLAGNDRLTVNGAAFKVREIYLLDARRRAKSIRSTRSEAMRRALIKRVLFDLREALRPATRKAPTQ